jgi:hypothetical protein
MISESNYYAGCIFLMSPVIASFGYLVIRKTYNYLKGSKMA